MLGIREADPMTESPLPLTVEFTVTAEDLARLSRSEIKRSRSSRLVVWGPVAVWLWMAWNSYSYEGGNWLTVICLILAACYGIPGLWERLFLYFVFWMARIREMHMRITVEDQHITIEDLTLLSGRPRTHTLNWNALINSGSARETADIFLLEYPTRRNRLPSRSVWIPKSAFASEVECENLRRLLRERLGEYFRSSCP